MPTDQLSIRRAEESDADSVAAIHIAARRQAQMPPAVHPDPEAYAWLSGRLGTDEVWLAELDGEAAGYARVTPGWLDDLYVAPRFAGRGVGSALLDLVKAQHPEGFCLWVFEMNLPARSFYARRGLIELEHTDGSANEEKAPDVRMAWPGRDPLGFYRSLIDSVDAELGELLNRRAALTAAVQRHKDSTERDPAREREIAEAMARRAPTLGADRLHRVVHAIITESLASAASASEQASGRSSRRSRSDRHETR